YLSALSDAKAARREATEAVRLDPSFRDPVLILGVHNYVAGSLPWTAKMFSVLLGYSGDKELGRRQIAEVAQVGEHSRTDADVMLVVLDRRDGLNAQAAPILERLTSEYPRNTLFAIESADALEAAGDHNAARAQYRRIVERAAAHAPGYERAPLDKIWYDLGSIDRLYSRWKQAADDYRQVANAPHAQPHYVQAAALALGEVELRAGDAQAARTAFERCVSLDPSSDAGRAAAEALRRNQ
ncbi:MAG TPA: tetratricopeptide repeat protein, partial [Terriglobales bacterium]